jgi:hypothetical protein
LKVSDGAAPPSFGLLLRGLHDLPVLHGANPVATKRKWNKNSSKKEREKWRHEERKGMKAMVANEAARFSPFPIHRTLRQP